MNKRITLEHLAGMATSMMSEIIHLWDQGSKYFSYFGYFY